MSGIYGFLHPSASEKNNDFLFRMKIWNRAYGKQEAKQHSDIGFGMGCCLEKLSEHAPVGSPIIKKENVYYAIDAVLYNRKELLQKSGCPSVLSDEELLIEYITKYGLHSLSEINGDFSGAIFDSVANKLTLFRDHMGVRPLFYYSDDSFAAFSTDIRGLISLPQVDISINEEWLYKTIMGFSTIHPVQTEFSHIFCIPPGGYLTIYRLNNALVSESGCYWTIGQQKVRLSSEKEYQQKLRELITDSVNRRLEVTSDPVGAELSGGLDSGVIDILLHRAGRKGIFFSWSDSPEVLPLVPKDERLVIQDICRQEGISCNYKSSSSGLGISSNIAIGMNEIGVPVREDENEAYRYLLSPTMNTLPICETAQFLNRAGAKVVFTGHGGDEGVSHRSKPYELFYHHEYYRFLRLLWSRTHGQKHRIVRTLKACYKTLWKNRKECHAPLQTVFSSPDLLCPDFSARFQKLKTNAHYFGFDPVSYIRNGGSRNRLDVVAFFGAYNSVRYVVPYLDYRVVDFAVSIPRYLYLRGFRNRFIFREAFKDIMPKSLYVLQEKRDLSYMNAEPDPNWFESFDKQRKDVMCRLSRGLWENYLDFEYIDTWLQQGKPTEEERTQYETTLYLLSLCALFENLVVRTREVTEAGLNKDKEK